MWLSRSDLRYTLRQMSRKPGFVLLAALVLAGGLAVSLMAFTITHTLLYRTLPITNGERIVHVCTFASSCAEFRPDRFARIRGEIEGVSNAGIYMERNATLEFEGEVWRTSAIETEWNLFELSESSALLGRTLREEDHAAGAEAVAVIGYEFWQQRFAGDPQIVGKVLSIDRQPVRIVGVMPEGYAMPYSAQLWLPIAADLLTPLASMAPMPLVWSYGLLDPGASLEQVNRQLTELVARDVAQYPDDPFAEYPSPYYRFAGNSVNAHVAYLPTSMLDGIGKLIATIVPNLLTLLVFLLVCINVGTLLLARINERMKDTSIRVALGASRGRLLVQLCLESTCITLLGAALAVLLAGMGLELVMFAVEMLGAGLLAFWMDFKIDASTLVAVVVYALLTIVLTSVVPGWRIVNGDFNAAMRDGTRGALGLKPGRFSRGLVVAALVIVTLLLYLVTLLSSSILPLTNALAKVPANLITGNVVLNPERYAEAARQQFVRSLTARMADEPDIAFANVLLDLGRGRIAAEGDVTATGDLTQAMISSQNVPRQGEIDPRFAAGVDDSLEVRLLEGRLFTDTDTATSEPVVTISESLAKKLWPGQSPIDRRLRIVGAAGIAEDWRRVVGVTSDNPLASFLTDNSSVSLVLPLAQIDTAGRRFTVNAFATIPAGKGRVMQYLRDEFAAVDTAVEPVVQDPATVLEGITGAFTMGVRLALLIGLFVFAVAIAGIYGLTQNTVLMATQEIGVRRALGARDGLITKMFMKRTGRQVAKGFIGAMLICAPVTLLFYLLAQEFGLNVPFSLAVSVLVIALLYAFVMLATYLPVRRILRMEPSDALRYE